MYIDLLYTVKLNHHILQKKINSQVAYFYSVWIQTIWTPEKQANMSLLKKSFSPRYSNFKYKKIPTPPSVSRCGVKCFDKLAY